MKRLFSILLLSGMLMAPATAYSNQYKDFAIGSLKGISTALILTNIVNCIANTNNYFKESWVPTPVYLGGEITGIYLWLTEGITSKNDTEKTGHRAGFVAAIAGIVAWCLCNK